MTQQEEQRRLLGGVRYWFEGAEQVEHYSATRHQGLSPAEQWLLRSLNTREPILDIGCGAGRVALQLAQRGAAITAADISRPLLRIAQHSAYERAMRLHWVQTDPLRLSFANGAFQSVLAIKVYCYIPTRNLRIGYLREIARLLRPRGELFMTQYVTPEEWMSSAYDDHYQQIAPGYTVLEEGDTFSVGEYGHSYVHWFTEQQLREEIQASGFKIDIFENDQEHGGEGYIQLLSAHSAA